MHTFNTLSEFHKFCALPKPEHPLISVVNYGQVDYQTIEKQITWMQNFYSIGLKRDIQAKVRYGQQEYDFDEGLLSFIGPRQVLQFEMLPREKKPSGWLLLIHPDFLWNTPLAKTIKNYEFFGYAINEALFLSEKEENTLVDVLLHIQQEYRSNIDKFSQNIIIAQLELLLNYAERYYQRQFLTRKINNHEVLVRLENLLDTYFNGEEAIDKGIPTVQFVADTLNVSSNYLSSLLKVLTGQSTQQHIHEKLIEKAKEKLSTTQLSVSEIAYTLGFEHSQSFSKLFKSKTKQSPLAFRASFN
ncbi:helix-turn-helix domain-containing protein [Flagellimonas aequoris]|uniref:AraC family transcriptional regulator n=1 Tax=Flagellimonas aequoris TaxID=2306997 RepID=A0A418N3D7_9FLAO|nr:helix-turn-helix transcriptional regulator [Allomuricauda aequoris]RIV68370.1 AraC family transcriptional regulator [Allomuricauda aequoris]TXK00062.1 helix-turn-helix transcriptional regulator [Allomuricauda aequoris]